MWILDNGLWLDLGVWDDTDFWQDYPVAGIILAADGGSYELTGTPATLLIQPAVSPPIFGGGIPGPERPALVYGVGYGILPPLQGEAFGVAGSAGVGAAELPPLSGLAIGAAGASGKSQARLTIKATGHGNRGAAGRAAGHIAGIKAASIGHHDEDEAVAIKFLLDA